MRYRQKIRIVILSIMIMTGCSVGNGINVVEEVVQEIVLDPNQEITLKVMYFSEEVEPNRLLAYYFELFEKKYPHITLEFIRHDLYQGASEREDDEALREIIKFERPDILQLNETFYKKLMEENKLVGLNDYMKRDNYDTEGLVPGFLNYMQGLGGEQLYGMPYSFFSTAFYYNKETFDLFMIDYPSDHMTWSDVADLLDQFPSEVQGQQLRLLTVNGTNDLWDIVRMIADTEGIQFVDSIQSRMNINTEGWKSVVNTALRLQKQDRINYVENSTPGNHISKIGFEQIYHLRFGSLDYVPQLKQYPIYSWDQWGLVTAPVSSRDPNQSNSYYFGDILSINVESENKDAAWKLLSYMTGEEYAEKVLQSVNRREFAIFRKTFPVRTSFVKKFIGEDHNYEALYKLEPVHRENENEVSEAFMSQFNDAAQQVMEEVSYGETTIDEALEYLHEFGEELLATE